MEDKNIPYTHHVAFTMAALVGTGSFIGGVVKGSRVSLLAGGLIAAAFGASGFYAQKGEYLVSNQIGGLAGAALTAGMGMRYLATRGFLPLGMSIAGAAATTFHINNWNKIEPIKSTTQKLAEAQKIAEQKIAEKK